MPPTPSSDCFSASLLVAHGSRDPRPQIALEHLAKLVSQRLQSPAQAAPPIGTAMLELAPLPLHQQIQQFAQQVAAQGYSQLQIVPLFLLPGVHVMEDIPAEVEQAQRAVQATGLPLTIALTPYLGKHPQIKDLLTNPVDPIATSPQSGKILLAHGSRRAGANRPVEVLAVQLRAIPAYWATAGSLEAQITALVKQGCREIAILPFLLFDGGLREAIEQLLQQLAPQFPYVRLHLGQSIGPTPQLADLVVSLVTA